MGTNVNGHATEWSNGSVIDLGRGEALSINNSGQIVGSSAAYGSATEWSDGSVIDLGGLPGASQTYAYSINDSGKVVGYSGIYLPPPIITVPESPTWALMLLGFAGLGYVGYRRSQRPVSISQTDV